MLFITKYTNQRWLSPEPVICEWQANLGAPFAYFIAEDQTQASRLVEALNAQGETYVSHSDWLIIGDARDRYNLITRSDVLRAIEHMAEYSLSMSHSPSCTKMCDPRDCDCFDHKALTMTAYYLAEYWELLKVTFKEFHGYHADIDFNPLSFLRRFIGNLVNIIEEAEDDWDGERWRVFVEQNRDVLKSV